MVLEHKLFLQSFAYNAFYCDYRTLKLVEVKEYNSNSFHILFLDNGKEVETGMKRSSRSIVGLLRYNLYFFQKKVIKEDVPF